MKNRRPRILGAGGLTMPGSDPAKSSVGDEASAESKFPLAG